MHENDVRVHTHPICTIEKCTVQVPVSGYAGCGVVGRVARGEGGVTSPDNTLL